MQIPMISLDTLEAFALVFLRTSAIVATMPILGDKVVPVRVKAGFALLLAGLLFPVVPLGGGNFDIGLLPLALRMASEAVIGVVIGFAAQVIFAGVQLAGELIGFQMGFAIVNVIDPVTSAQVSIIAEFQYLVALLLFLIFNGHHLFIAAIAESFRVLNPLSLNYSGALIATILELSKGIFTVAVKLSAPLVAVMFFTQIALGIVARTVPQINIFIVGFPLQIAVGLLFLGLCMPVFAFVLERMFSGLDGQIQLLMRTMIQPAGS